MDIHVSKKALLVAGVALLALVASLAYLLLTRTPERRLNIESQKSTVSNLENSKATTSPSEILTPRVTIENALAKDALWKIDITLPSIGKSFTVEERSWMTEDALFYYQAVGGTASQQDESRQEMLATGATLLASTTWKSQYKTSLSAEVLRLSQLREANKNARLVQSNSLKIPLYTAGLSADEIKKKEKASREVQSLTRSIIEMYDSDILLLGYMIDSEKKILDALDKENNVLLIDAINDETLVRIITPWYEGGIDLVGSKIINLQTQAISNDLQTLSNTLSTIAAQESASTTPTP